MVDMEVDEVERSKRSSPPGVLIVSNQVVILFSPNLVKKMREGLKFY